MRPNRPLLLDAALAGGACVLDLAAFWQPTGSAADPWVPLFAAAGCAALVWRRRFPGTVFLVLLGHALLAWAMAPVYVPTLGLLVALYTVASRTGPLRAGLALAAMSGPVAIAAVTERASAAPADRTDALVVAGVLSSLLTLTVFGAGRWVAWTRRQRVLAAERAAADAVEAERRRIARDLHDVVAHTVTLMMLQSAGAARVLRVDQDRAETALDAVGTLGQQAVVELRRMLAVLAPSDDRPEPTSAPVGIEDVPVLVEQVRLSGRRVVLAEDGAPVPLDAGVGLCAYRIVQEALTNATRYGDPERAIRVRIGWCAGTLDLVVRNEVPAGGQVSALSTGRGLVGMRERAASVGGHLTAGPDGDRGYAVEVSLPIGVPAGPPAIAAAR
ncbi:sensor histidine kinase [Cryptosporangium phraense]|uniref:histidine kinase n=1 Tax=Cryptosporangium phraense TaxID=2593070 RepID=A0A545AKY1_9ACTN|nr:histidine kinase [Cryptosporangium phraense]TQS41977.1 hypothetical protein FL583_27240 [Cryptosporangium phraense]